MDVPRSLAGRDSQSQQEIPCLPVRAQESPADLQGQHSVLFATVQGNGPGNLEVVQYTWRLCASYLSNSNSSASCPAAANRPGTNLNMTTETNHGF